MALSGGTALLVPSLPTVPRAHEFALLSRGKSPLSFRRVFVTPAFLERLTVPPSMIPSLQAFLTQPPPPESDEQEEPFPRSRLHPAILRCGYCLFSTRTNPGGDGIENVSVVKSELMPGFSLKKTLGEPKEAAEKLLSTVIAPPDSGKCTASLCVMRHSITAKTRSCQQQQFSGDIFSSDEIFVWAF